MARALDGTRAAIRQCAARRERDGAAAAEAFGALPARPQEQPRAPP